MNKAGRKIIDDCIVYDIGMFVVDKNQKTRNGFPKYKSAKHSRKSDTTNNQNGTIAIIDKGIKLPKIGIVKAVIHKQPDSDWKIKPATVSQDSDGKFYASVLFE